MSCVLVEVGKSIKNVVVVKHRQFYAFVKYFFDENSIIHIPIRLIMTSLDS